MTAVAWPDTDLTVSPDEAAVLAEVPRRLPDVGERLATALHCLATREDDDLALVRVMVSPSLSDENLTLWWETYRTAVRACDAIALGGDDAWREFYDADDLVGGPGLSNADAAEQMAAQDADEALTVLTGGAR